MYTVNPGIINAIAKMNPTTGNPSLTATKSGTMVAVAPVEINSPASGFRNLLFVCVFRYTQDESLDCVFGVAAPALDRVIGPCGEHDRIA